MQPTTDPKNQTAHNENELVTGPFFASCLGHYLEIDLLPGKTCSFNCIYCCFGRTPAKTIIPGKGVSPGEIIAALKPRLSSDIDCIMISGSGEPTLYAEIREVIRSIQKLTDTPVAVVTNGSLLWQPEVRKNISTAHIVIPSLDAADPLMYKTVNRPHDDISFDQIIEGLKTFRCEYTGKYWLETMLLPGYTAIPSEIKRLTGHIRKIRPDKILLNTPTAPSCESYALAVNQKRLASLAENFSRPTEIIPVFDKTEHPRSVSIKKDFLITPEAKGDHYARI